MKKQSFDDWMKKVNAEIERKCGMGVDDLPDWRYHQAWEDGVSPIRAAASVIAAAKRGY